MNKNVILLIIVLLLIILTFRLSRLLLSISEIKNRFICKNCNKLNNKLLKKCEHCKTLMQKDIKLSNQSYIILTRRNVLNNGVVEYKKVKNALIQDIVLNVLGLIVLVIILSMKICNYI